MHHLLTGVDPAIDPFKFTPPDQAAGVSPGLGKLIMEMVKQNPGGRPADEMTYSSIKKSSTITAGALSGLAIFMLDVLSVCCSVLFAALIRNAFHAIAPVLFDTPLLPGTVEAMWWLPLLLFFFLAHEGLYRKRLPVWTEVKIIVTTHPVNTAPVL